MVAATKVEYDSFAEWLLGNWKKVLMWAGLGIVGIIVLSAIPKSFYTVPAGNRGLLFTFGKLDPIPTMPGFHFKVPFTQDVAIFNVQMRESNYDNVQAASIDTQTVTSTLVVNYTINPDAAAKVYEGFNGWEGFEGKILQPAILQCYKDITAKYKANAILANREAISNTLHEQLLNKMVPFPFVNIIMTSITNIGFSPEYTKAIEEKQVAEQDAQKAVYKAQEAKNMAQARINTAEGQATEARLLRVQTDKTVLARMWIEKWNGDLPQVMSGAGQGFMLNLNGLGTKTAPAAAAAASDDDK